MQNVLSAFYAPGELIISLLLTWGFEYIFKMFISVFFPTFAKLRARPRVPEYFPSPLPFGEVSVRVTQCYRSLVPLLPVSTEHRIYPEIIEE